MVLWLAQRFLAQGKKVAVLTRGYKGSQGSSDEIEMLKRRLDRKVLFGVGSDRFASGTRLESENKIDVFLLDDGFQHLQLARDLDILMLDGSRELEKEWLLPAGALREPIAARRRADILVISRKLERPLTEAKDAQSFSIFCAQTRLLGFRRFGSGDEEKYVAELGSGPFVAFCGIGNPTGFFDDLCRWHVPLAVKEAYPDHHRYSSKELAKLCSIAERCGASGLVTTEKDAENLGGASARLPIWIAVIDFVFTAESELLAAIDRKLASRQGAAA
jgi:tetraacyldisaccharide 4'-kinase